MPALYVIRHGEPARKGVLLGRSDPPLSEAGRAQMRALHLPVTVAYASPLRRAWESAELLGVPVVVLAELAEISLGEWDGRTWAEIEAADPELARRKIADWKGVTPPGGERWQDFTRRIDHALDSIRQGRFPAAVVAHQAVNAWLVHRITGAKPEIFQQEYGQADEYQL